MMLNAAKTLTKEILELAGEDYIDNFSLTPWSIGNKFLAVVSDIASGEIE